MTRETTEWLTTDELAAELKVTEITLRAWRRTGSGPRYVKLGSAKSAGVRYARSDINAWLASRTIGTQL